MDCRSVFLPLFSVLYSVAGKGFPRGKGKTIKILTLLENGNYNAMVGPLLHGGSLYNYCIIYAKITHTRHKDFICRTVEQALSHCPPVPTLSRASFISCDILPTRLLCRLLISRRRTPFKEHASVVQKLDSAIHGILKTLSSI